MSRSDGPVRCPLCEGNASVPGLSVVPLLRLLARKMLGLPSPQLVRLTSGKVMEIRELSESEVQSLASGTLAGLPIWQCSPQTIAGWYDSG